MIRLASSLCRVLARCLHRRWLAIGLLTVLALSTIGPVPIDVAAAGPKMNKLFTDAALTDEDYQFAVGQTVYAQASSLSSNRGYKLEAKNASGASAYLGSCKSGATTATDSYAPTTASGAADWTWVLH